MDYVCQMENGMYSVDKNLLNAENKGMKLFFRSLQLNFGTYSHSYLYMIIC